MSGLRADLPVRPRFPTLFGVLMRRTLDLQETVFAVVALGVAACAAVLPRWSEQSELCVIAGLIVLLGVPHGALDPVFARRQYALRSWAGWLAALALYLALSALVVLVWRLAPVVFLSGFLILAALHFSGDLDAGVHGVSRIAYGFAVIILPTVLHEDETRRIFLFIAGPEAASLAASALHALSQPWLAALLACAAFEAGARPRSALVMAAIACMATLAPPLVSFAVFFCGMHSARHILRTLDYAEHWSARALIAVGVAPMAVVASAAFVLWRLYQDAPFEARVLQIMFVGLAALTAPHMALVERVRLAGGLGAQRASS